jgi:hypothetical protein
VRWPEVVEFQNNWLDNLSDAVANYVAHFVETWYLTCMHGLIPQEQKEQVRSLNSSNFYDNPRATEMDHVNFSNEFFS